MHAVGISDLYEDFIEPTADLLETQAGTLPNHDGGAQLLAIFNDEAPSSQLTYSFKVESTTRRGLLLSHHHC